MNEINDTLSMTLFREVPLFIYLEFSFCFNGLNNVIVQIITLN